MTAPVRIVLCGMFAFAALALFAGYALPHAWYEWECCSGIDCQEIADETVTARPGGFAVTLMPGDHKMVTSAPVSGWFTFRDVRPSQDGRYHACVVAGVIKCLYIPQGSA